MRAVLNTNPPRVIDVAQWQLDRLIAAGMVKEPIPAEADSSVDLPEVALAPEPETTVMRGPLDRQRPGRRRKRWQGR